MNAKAVYARLGGDYDAMLAMLQSDAVIVRLLAMLPKDASMGRLAEAIKQKDADAAFRAAHTLKGVALSLHLPHLTEKASVLTEILRPRKLEHYESSYAELQEEYENTLRAIAEEK